MKTASQTMIARQVGHDRERRGLALMVAGAVVLVLAFAASHQWPPRVLVDNSREVR